MTPGRLIAVVGPSGVGKDSVLAGIADAAPHLRRVRRAVTRPETSGGEPHEAMTQADFESAAARGAFCLHWAAHGLLYGIPSDVARDLAAGRDVIANLSRAALPEAGLIFPRLIVLNLTARPETLAARLAGRGREDAKAIARRLDRAAEPLPGGFDTITIANDGPLTETVARALAALDIKAAPACRTGT
jgi:ribose 1,5-bisphosphokinase